MEFSTSVSKLRREDNDKDKKEGFMRVQLAPVSVHISMWHLDRQDK